MSQLNTSEKILHEAEALAGLMGISSIIFGIPMTVASFVAEPSILTPCIPMRNLHFAALGMLVSGCLLCAFLYYHLEFCKKNQTKYLSKALPKEKEQEISEQNPLSQEFSLNPNG